ncbi:MAG: adenylate kinase [Clostridia bacterium]|nr:adenylate kinase [Clostridia bacterium]
MKLIFFGPPGAGKGTQAALLAETLGVPTISTGNIIREEIAAGSELGVQARQAINEGRLVADETVIGIVKTRLAKPDCAGGFILDGFPRTVAQAEGLCGMGIIIDKVIDIEVADDALIKRMSGRRVCLKCGATYHLENNPSPAGDRCGVCGEPLSVREDDREEVVRERLAVFHRQTEPLEAYYRERGILFPVSGDAPIEKIASDIVGIVRG